MTVYDLHSHSTASDGRLTPAQLLAEASRQGVDVLALTDHDTLDGLDEAAGAAESSGLRLIPGVEISVTWRARLFHIVGLGVDRNDAALRHGLTGLRGQRERRAERMAVKLAQAGIPEPLAGARRYQTTRILSRTHFAHYLAEIGAADSIEQAFDRYLYPGRPGYVAMEWATLKEAIGWIKGAGGVAVVAHPGRYRLDAIEMESFLRAFVDAGGGAIEVVYAALAAEQVRRFSHYARRFGLFASLGSDFHRQGTERCLGRLPPLPADLTPVWQAPELSRSAQG
ncbi:MAG: PHP domain-containing protein [Gammaproteobacteria bacterium]|nr:PHP domain-containing protein [Gammaproteobacteria bacterium]